MRMAVGESIENGEARVACFSLRGIFLLDNAVKQFTAHHLFCDQVRLGGRLKDGIQANNVLVLELCQNVNLFRKSFLLLFI